MKELEHIIKFEYDKKYLYRFMPVEQFVSMVLNNQNTLVRPSCWDDPDEKLISEQEGCIAKDFFQGKRWFGQCWTRNEECEAFWRRYCNKVSGRCVKIKVLRKNLKMTLKRYHDDNVRYALMDVMYAPVEFIKDNVENAKGFSTRPREKYKGHEIVRQIVECNIQQYKRKAYEYEEETRILVYHENDVPEEDAWGYYFNVNRNVEEIMLDPWTPEYLVAIYRKMFKKLGVKDVETKVVKSALYTPLVKT